MKKRKENKMKTRTYSRKLASLFLVVIVCCLFTGLRCPDLCFNNDHCWEHLFCAKRVGDCEGIGKCVQRPQGCPDVYDPVCGCDGLTHSNACDAAAAGISVAYEGECASLTCRTNSDCPSVDPTGVADTYCSKELGDCEGRGACLPRPQGCYEIYAPVCGCDGRTYSNDCFAAAAGVNIEYEGPCRPVPCVSNEDCSPYDPAASLNNYCAKDVGDCDGLGLCTARPEECILLYLPVCGCDGETYPNSCDAAREGVNVLGEVPCNDIFCDDVDCGPPPAMPNYMCEDGTWAGPTGRCLWSSSGACSWEIRDCP